MGWCLRRVLAPFLIAFAATPAAALQVPDTLRADSVRADTTDRTQRFLESQREARARTPVFPPVGDDRLLPPLSRLVFDRDSIDWRNAETVGDLLRQIPGVFLWRGGWVGRAELPNYQARGATSVEYLLDGMPFVPLGPDSVAVDPSFLALSLFERVEVERQPGLLRVHLMTRRHDQLVPRSRIGIASGDFDIARYQASLERRGASGFGFVLAADHFAVPVPGAGPGEYRNTTGFIQTSYLPSPRFGLLLEWHRMGPRREVLLAPGSTTDTIAPGVDGRRTDLMARMHWQAREEGTGPRLDVLLGRSTWSDRVDDSLSRTVHQAGAVLAWRGRRASVDGSVFWRSIWSPLDLRARAAAAPGRLASMSVETGLTLHDEGRSSRWVTGRAGLSLSEAVSLAGTLRAGSIVAAPAIRADTAQSVRDASVALAWRRPRVSGELAFSHLSAYQPVGYRQFAVVDHLGAIPAGDWFTLRARVAPRQWFAIEGQYSNPVGNAPDGQPRTHSLVSAEIRSKFLRTFRSGIFDLKLQASMETWGTGVIGRAADSTAIILPGATFFRALIQLQFDAFIMYFDQYNLTGSRLGYVPGYPVPTAARTFGVRWEFLN